MTRNSVTHRALLQGAKNISGHTSANSHLLHLALQFTQSLIAVVGRGGVTKTRRKGIVFL